MNKTSYYRKLLTVMKGHGWDLQSKSDFEQSTVKINLNKKLEYN